MDRPTKPGDRIRLIEMLDDPNPIAVGAMGTVRSVTVVDFRRSPELQIAVDWDNGRTLSLVYPPDKFEVVTENALPF